MLSREVNSAICNNPLAASLKVINKLKVVLLLGAGVQNVCANHPVNIDVDLYTLKAPKLGTACLAHTALLTLST